MGSGSFAQEIQPSLLDVQWTKFEMVQIKALAATYALSNSWLPCNPAVHELVLTKLKRGFYNADKRPLVTDLAGDIGLYTYCLRSLAQEGRATQKSSFDTVTLFSAASTERLKEMLDKKTGDLSIHSFNNPPEGTATCLHTILLAAAATESLTEKARFPASTGFTATILRHLGLLLITWNYPHIFRLACRSARSIGSLDAALCTHLGYSPRTLGILIAREWGLPVSFRHALGDSDACFDAADPSHAKALRAAEILKTSCEVGELLAQANYPDLYPEGKRKWTETRRKLETALGPAALNIIHQRLGVYAKEYLLANQSAFQSLQQLPVEVHHSQQMVEQPCTSHSSSPPDDDPASPELLAVIRELYSSIDPTRPQKKNVLNFTQTVVPMAGFPGGCIYMYDFESSELIPRYRFGSCPPATERVKLSALGPSIHPVAEAFRGNHAVMEHNPWHDHDIGYVAQTFGNIQRVGVFYLQIGPELADEHTDTILKLFGRMRKVLMDCLGVR